jgi:UDP-N-acetylglucosamine--N-acetylmuramyl-(pentapeptide) pyrophosphoryl-undecaprenol N-acetylglucosamine transferase
VIKVRVIISAGGTGGHIYPALAIINKIKEKEPNSEILYIGTTDRMEKDIIPNNGIDFVGIKVKGFERKLTLENFTTISYFFEAIRESRKIISKFKPDIVIGVGGYVTAPVIYAAKKLGYKTMIHEQNSVVGLANRFLLKYSDIIATSFSTTINYIGREKDRVIYTGNPCSENALTKKPMDRTEFGLSKTKKLVLIVMGSLGSSTINEKMKEILPSFKDKEYEVLFVTGKAYYEEFKAIDLKNVKIVPYIEDMIRIMKSTDLIVSRAGATTMSEIIALAIPSILIPSPHVTDNHQLNNAIDLVGKDAAILIEEEYLKPKILIDEIDSILNNEKRYNKMKKNLLKSSITDSSTKIYQEIKKILGDAHGNNSKNKEE